MNIKEILGTYLTRRDEMMTWVTIPDQFRVEALRQVEAAKGMRVIWRVGPDQVKAFQKDLNDIAGVTVKP